MSKSVQKIPINITGPMFSGKTSTLISLLERERIAENKCLIIKFDKDLRFGVEDGDNMLITHSNFKYDKCEIKYVKKLDNNLYLYIMTGSYKVIGIEEGQFFPNVDKFVDLLSLHNLKVIITSLNGNYLQQPWEHISKLNARANVIQLKAICLDCKDDNGVYTARIIKSNDLIVIGGTESYRSVCKKCIIRYNSPADIIVSAYKEFCKSFYELDGTIFNDLNIASDVIKQFENISYLFETHKKNRSTITDPIAKYAYCMFYKKVDDLFDTIITYRVLIN